MKRSQGAVRLGSITPFFNNVVSLMCGILVFSTVFSVQKQDGKTQDEIVQTLQFNGPGNTGLTFIWSVSMFVLTSSVIIAVPAYLQDATSLWKYQRRQIPSCHLLPLSVLCWSQFSHLSNGAAYSRAD